MHNFPSHPAADRFRLEAIEQRLWIDAASHRVPAVLWTPSRAEGRRPLVLIGHGGSHHKTAQQVLDVAAPLVLQHGFAVAAIDGPVHGERRAVFDAGPAVQAEFRALWAKGGSVETMLEDWKATLDHLCSRPEVNTQSIGWYGVSMGTAYGLPFVANDARIKVAVLGMWGTSRVNSQRLVTDAEAVHIPVLFQQKSADQLFTAEGQLEIYQALASADKRLVEYEGGHGPSGAQVFDAIDFLGSRLGIGTRGRE
ncbi:MAG: dienelactone hydrolase family protein [Pseudomonadota bacterium]